MNQINLKNRLDVSNGTTKNELNNAMQPASQTTESPETAKKRLGLLAVLVVGVNAAASFLKSKMEKVAAVASQVGAAILKSKKAVSAAAASILGDIQPKPQKIAENRLAKAKARLAVSAPILALLAGIFSAQPQGMAVPRGTWLPKYEMTQKYRNVTQFAPQTYLWTTEIEFSSEYRNPDQVTAFLRVRAVAVEEQHKAGRYSVWYKKFTYLTLQGNKITRHEFIRNKKRVWKWYTAGGHLDLVFHSKVGEMETVSTLGQQTTRFGSVRQQEKITEKWKNKVYFHETQRMSGGPFHFRVHFGARNDFIPSDDLNCTGYCEAGRISAYPGSATSVSPCVPSNMSMPRNGYLEFHHWTQHVPPPVRDEDDE